MNNTKLVNLLRHEAALDSTFERGRTVAGGKGVLSYDVDEGKFSDIFFLTGVVEGSKGNRYDTYIGFDTQANELVDYGCTCPASQKYRGLCKHSVALALRYFDDTGQLPNTPKPVKVQPVTGYMFGLSSTTSPELSGVLDVFDQNARDEAERMLHRPLHAPAEDESAPELSLIPRVEPFYDPLFGQALAWAITFRIKCGGTYCQVKSVDEFLEARRVGTPLAFSRSLSVTVGDSAFDERSQGVLRVIDRARQRLADMFALSKGYEHTSFGKQLPVTEEDVCHLLDLFMDDDIGWQSAKGAKRALSTVHVVDADPRLTVRIVKTPYTYDLMFPTGWTCVGDEERLYLIDGGRAWRCTDAFARDMSSLVKPLMKTGLPMHIGSDDLARFCRSVLPRLNAHTVLSAPPELNDVAPKPWFTFTIGVEGNLVMCHVDLAYGDATASFYDMDANPTFAGYPRDLVFEARANIAVCRYFPNESTDPCFDYNDDEALYELLTSGLKELSGYGQVLLSDRLRGIAVKPVPRLSVTAQVNNGLLNVELGASGLKPQELEEFLAGYKRRQKFVRLKDGDIFRLDDAARRQLDELQRMADGLDVEAVDLAYGVDGLPRSRALFMNVSLERAGRQGVVTTGNTEFKAVVHALDTLGQQSFEVPASLAQTLRGYQVDGYQWMRTLEHLGFGGILADDMGLGKTLQVITCIVAGKEAGDSAPTLVVCPASLVYNWTAELKRFAPQLSCAAVAGQKKQRDVLLAGAYDTDVLVTSYDLLRRDIDSYQKLAFRRLVLDEAQYIKNPLTKVAKAATQVSADVCFALTGTPIENRLSELWSIFNVCVPGLLGGLKSFTKRYASPVENEDDGAQQELRAVVSPFILRRLKTDVLADLPDKTETVVYSQMQGEQEKLYRASEDRLALQVAKQLPRDMKKNKLQVLAELTKLRQICCDPRLHFDGYKGPSAKLDTCLELVRDALEGAHRVLVFSQFVSMLDILHNALAKEGVAHMSLVGSTSKEDRAGMVERFQAGEGDVFLISLKAGGVGLTLTGADIVIHYDPWWNVAAQNQATDRAYRIGQERDVTVYRIIAKNTIEERILAMQERKADLADAVLGGKAVASSLVSREDILALLGA